MTDLTQITTPFGLLDKETQNALKAHGGPYDTFTRKGWSTITEVPSWFSVCVYRVKPAPPKPREWYAYWSDNLCEWVLAPNKEYAELANDMANIGIIHVREVVGGDE